MKKIITIRIVLAITILLMSQICYANTCLYYSYDATGNRTGRIAGTCRIANPQDSTIENHFEVDYGMSIYPNPASEGITISITNLGENDVAKLVLSDIQGKSLLVNPIHNKKHSIDLRKFSAGLYFLTVTLNKETLVYKIQKN